MRQVLHCQELAGGGAVAVHQVDVMSLTVDDARCIRAKSRKFDVRSLEQFSNTMRRSSRHGLLPKRSEIVSFVIRHQELTPILRYVEHAWCLKRQRKWNCFAPLDGHL